MRSDLCCMLVALTIYSAISKCNGDACNTRCQWLTWKSWTACSATCGGGTRQRTRSLCCDTRLTFTQCRTSCGLDNSPYYERSSCNQICYNGGVMGSFSCTCAAAYYGSCCSNKIQCSTPSSLTNGYYTGTDFTYGKSIKYYCSNKYKLINGDATHTCSRRYSFSSVGYWSGSVPYCAYMASCESSPCQNGGSCLNGEDKYSCVCPAGYSGDRCQFDIQPPVYTNCSSDFTVHIAKKNVEVNWIIPEFSDPHGHSVTVSSNYLTNSALMPWGDFVVQYVATKTTNALKNECKFTVSIRPYPCKELEPPANGAFACNGWNGHFTEVCALYCQSDHTTTPDIDIQELFVCGASGKWSASKVDVACSENRLDNINADHYYDNTCASTSTKVDIRDRYVQMLNSSDYSDLCSQNQWTSLCNGDNVKIIC